MATEDMDAALSAGRIFVESIVRHDWERISSCFEPDGRLRAVVPKANPFRDQTGGEAAAALIQAWFGHADVTELLSSSVETMGDRVHLAYRIREHTPEGWNLVEQHAFITPGHNGIEFMNLLCSGFRPAPEQRSRLSSPN